MEKNCTIRDLAKYVGLSTCTVSKVLNDTEKQLAIPEKTRTRVREAARLLRYVPNVHAQRFFTRRSCVIGLLVPPQEEMGHNAFRDTHFTDMLSGIEAALSATPYNLLMLFNRPEYREENRYHGLFSSGSVDGLLIWGIHRSDRYWKELVELTGPRIFLTSTPDFASNEAVNFIASDYEQSAFGITERLLQAGARRIGWLAGKADTSIIPQIEAGIVRAGTKAHSIRYSEYTEHEGEKLAAELLAEGCDTILATAPQLARGAQKTGVKLIGCCDGQHWTRHADDRFVTALTNDVEIGRLAAERLTGLMEGGDGNIQIKVPVNFSV